MKTLTRLATLSLILSVVVVLSGCSTTPVVYESGSPSSRIVVKYDGYNNCGYDKETTQTLSTRNTRASETSWSFGGKAGVGGRVPLGFLLLSLDIEAAIDSHYNWKETRTWEDSTTEEIPIAAHSHLLRVVYYQEITRRGTIEYYGKRIDYEFPADMTILGSSRVNVPCTPEHRFQVRCPWTSDGSAPSLPPAYQGIDRT